MKNFINYTIATSLASIGATILGVVLIDNLVVAALWAVGVLAIHSVAITMYGYYEIKAEFGIKSIDRYKSREADLPRL